VTRASGQFGATDAAPPRGTRLAIRLTRYVLERFPIATYGPLIVALVICGRSAGAVAAGVRPQMDWATAAVAVCVGLAFLQLRILDDVRDEGADRAGRPDRPLPRGLVSAVELRALAGVVAVIGVVLAAPLGATAVTAYLAAIAAIWTLELDLPRRLLPIPEDVLSTALLHSVIAPLVLLFVWTTNAGLMHVGPLAATLLLVWGSSLGMEIARKTLEPAEERPGVETYSAALGRGRAVGLTALAVSVALVGAGVFAATTAAPAPLIAAPLAAAGTILLLARHSGVRFRTIVLHAGAAITVLSALLWPLAVALVVP
jgi:4-hydroxybenzoate polyprenyltransferase